MNPVQNPQSSTDLIKNKEDVTVSSHFMDIMINAILEADLNNIIELSTRLPTSTNYGNDLVNWYRAQDIAWAEEYCIKGLPEVELCVLDALARWSFRNTGDLMRSAIGLIGACLTRVVKNPSRDQIITATETGPDVYESFISEPIWTVRRVFQTAATAGSIDAKIPLRSRAEVFNNLTAFSVADKTTPVTEQRDRQARLLTTVFPNTQLVESVMSPEDFAISRLIQMTKAVSKYKRDDGFDRLRSLMTNGSMVASMIRAKSVKDVGLGRLCSDVMDMFHSIDRLLNSNCVAANGLLERMRRGELVYDEILTMGRHQHRIMAVEFLGAVTLFSYLLKSANLKLSDDPDITNAMKRLMNFCGVAEQYSNEIVSKQFRR